MAKQEGMFNFQDMFKDFYEYEPDEDDAEGRMMKNAFQGNFIQSGIDAALAQQLSQFNSGIAQGNMTHQADLEQRNQSALMKDEFNYIEQSKASDFKYKNTFADAQNERDLGMVAATGQQDRLNVQAQGQQDRLNVITQGEQQRAIDANNNASKEAIASGRYEADKAVATTAADANKYGADKSARGFNVWGKTSS